MSEYNRLIGIDEFTGARVDDRISPDVFAALLGEYLRGRLLRGMLRPDVDGAGQHTAQTATTVFSPSLVTVGTLAVLIAASDASKTIASVADSEANTWTVDLTGNGDTGTEFLSVASSPITTELDQLSTITITWSDAASSTVERHLFKLTGALAATPFDQGVVTYQASEVAASAPLDPTSVPSAVMAVFRTNAGSGVFSLEDSPNNALISLTTDDSAGVIASVYQPNTHVTMGGTWSVAGDGVSAMVAYKALEGSYLPDLVERELSSPLTYDERELLGEFCDEVDLGTEAYVNELREVLFLTHRETPGYRDQATVRNMLGVF